MANLDNFFAKKDKKKKTKGKKFVGTSPAEMAKVLEVSCVGVYTVHGCIVAVADLSIFNAMLA